MSSHVAADYLGLARESLYRLIDEGALPAYEFSGVIRLKHWEVDAFIDRTRVQPGSLKHLYWDAADAAEPPGQQFANDEEALPHEAPGLSDAAPDLPGRDYEASPQEDQLSSRMIERIGDALLEAAAERPPDLSAGENPDG